MKEELYGHTFVTDEMFPQEGQEIPRHRDVIEMCPLIMRDRPIA